MVEFRVPTVELREGRRRGGLGELLRLSTLRRTESCISCSVSSIRRLNGGEGVRSCCRCPSADAGRVTYGFTAGDKDSANPCHESSGRTSSGRTLRTDSTSAGECVGKFTFFVGVGCEDGAGGGEVLDWAESFFCEVCTVWRCWETKSGRPLADGVLVEVDFPIEKAEVGRRGRSGILNEEVSYR